MRDKKIDEFKLIELEELINKTLLEMREQYPSMTIGDLQTVAVFSKMLCKNIEKNELKV